MKLTEEKNIVEFTGCRHLNFKPEFSAKRQLTNKGLFWMREIEPSMVQFCNQRGRIYGCESCLTEKDKQCNDYEEILHKIEVSLKELQ